MNTSVSSYEFTAEGFGPLASGGVVRQYFLVTTNISNPNVEDILTVHLILNTVDGLFNETFQIQ